MKQYEISETILMFNTYIEQINLSFNQYLFLGQEPLLVHTGNFQQTAELVPLLERALNGKSLAYVFISHFEADECGGLSILLEHYPQVKVICSPITARQLGGFGIVCELQIANPKNVLAVGENELEFIRYPSEMHLWEGLLVFEKRQGIFFSSDLFLRMGSFENPVAEADWLEEVNKITLQQVPSPEAKEALQNTLKALPVQAIALGHGPFLKTN